MKFTEGSQVYLKPAVANDINSSDVRGGKWMQADAPFTVKEVDTKKNLLLVKRHSGVGFAHVKMEDAVPADVYERLPHVVAAKEATAAALLVQQREESEEAREERRYRERRDFMLEHGRPMTDVERIAAKFKELAEGYTVDTCIVTTGRTSWAEPKVVDHVIHVSKQEPKGDLVLSVPKSNGIVKDRDDATVTRADHVAPATPRGVVFNRDESTKRLQEALIKMNEKGFAVSSKDVEKVLMDIHQPISITLDGIKIGEVKQFSGNPMKLHEHKVTPRRLHGGENFPSAFYATFTLAKKEE